MEICTLYMEIPWKYHEIAHVSRIFPGWADPQLTEEPKGHLPGATTAPAGINGLKADEVTQKYGYYDLTNYYGIKNVYIYIYYLNKTSRYIYI